MNAVDRFWSHVDKAHQTGCWPWKLSVNVRSGYGQVGAKGLPFPKAKRMALAHRVAYVLGVGELIDGMEIDHRCNVRRCCNPHHLKQVTKTENMARTTFLSLENPRNRLGLRTHCVKGHEYPADPGRDKTGARVCRVCNGIASAACKKRKAAKAH